MSKPSQPSPASKWISAYLDGTITDADFASLCAYLRESPEHLEALAAAAQLDEMMRDSLSHADQVDLLADDAQSAKAKAAAIDTVDRRVKSDQQWETEKEDLGWCQTYANESRGIRASSAS